MWETCANLQGHIVTLRRALHQIPEVGLDLPETTAFVAGQLEALGIPYQLLEGCTSILATVQGAGPGRTLALRADMDALPIQEETGLPFASRHPGCMHACGHDAHAAMLLGAAKVLQEHRAQWKGTVKLLFQTAEEQCIGAETIIRQGVLQGVEGIFGMHIGTLLGPDIPSGTVIVPTGCCMASFDKFILRVNGSGCHGSTPEKGVDPINIAAHIVLALQAITTREVSATRALVLTIGKIQGGSQFNIIPDRVVLEGTFRTVDPELRQYAARRIQEVAQATAAVFGGSVSAEVILGSPPVINDAALSALAARAAASALGPERVVTSLSAPNMGGEDFACYQERVPGAYLFLSSANHAKGTDVPHHSPRFDVDEDVLWEGSALFVALAEEFLKQ